MMSLFSSFDLKIFGLASLSFAFIPLTLCLSYWPISFSGQLNSSFFSLMSLFFKSLSNFKFKYFDSFILALMATMLLFNFFSILPYFFSYTSQVSFNLSWGLSLWLALFLLSVHRNLKYVLIHFVPEGTPLPLVWFLFFVELVSNLIRPLTLVIRLLANILAGHLLMILLSKMVIMMPPFFLMYLGLNLVEFFVSLIQAYIFVTMLCLYFSEVS